jgi:colicin import membrane protein
VPPAPQLPPTPPPAQDTIDRERVAREGQLAAAEEQREQDERRKREQVELEVEERLTQMQREREKQLEDIRRLREEASKRREREEQRLAQLEDNQRADVAERERSEERQRTEDMVERENAQNAGTGGTENSLEARYIFALQQVVTQNWLRPDTARGGLRCTVRIVQLPGGEVIDATVVPPCNGDPLTQRSLEAAVMRAQPLPYQGYESVFQRSINFVFRYDG